MLVDMSIGRTAPIAKATREAQLTNRSPSHPAIPEKVEDTVGDLPLLLQVQKGPFSLKRRDRL